jgi:hypothetical protein
MWSGNGVPKPGNQPIRTYNKKVGVDLILNCFKSSAGGEYIKSVKFALVGQFVCQPWKLQAGSVRLEI